MPLGSSPAAAALVSAMGSSAATFGGVASAAINAAGYGSGGSVNGVLARRSGITPGSPLGVGWETIIGVSECNQFHTKTNFYFLKKSKRYKLQKKAVLVYPNGYFGFFARSVIIYGRRHHWNVLHILHRVKDRVLI